MTDREQRPETSAIRFIESIKFKMEMMIRTGDVASRPRNRPGQPSEHRGEIQEETRIAIALLKAGKSATQAGQAIGITGNALHRRLNSRGLTIAKIREAMYE